MTWLALSGEENLRHLLKRKRRREREVGYNYKTAGGVPPQVLFKTIIFPPKKLLRVSGWLQRGWPPRHGVLAGEGRDSPKGWSGRAKRSQRQAVAPGTKALAGYFARDEEGGHIIMRNLLKRKQRK